MHHARNGPLNNCLLLDACGLMRDLQCSHDAAMDQSEEKILYSLL